MAGLLDRFFEQLPGGLFASLPPQLQAAARSAGGLENLLQLMAQGNGAPAAAPGQVASRFPSDQEQLPQAAPDVPLPRPRPPMPPALVLQDQELAPAGNTQQQLRGGGQGLSAAALPTPQPPPQYRPRQEMYQPPPQQEPGVLDRIGAGFSNLLNNPSLPGLVQGAQGFATGRYTDPSSIAREYQMATYNNLRRAGYSHPDAAMAANNPVVLKQLIEQAYAPQKLQGFQPGESVYSTGGGGLGGGRGGLNVQQLTPGLSVAEQAAQRAAGETRGKMAATLPATMQTFDQALATIDALQNHPGKKYAVGSWHGVPLNLAPAIGGTEQGNFISLLEQAQGQTFLNAYQALKGGGPISEKEGEKAQQAMGRLQRAQTPQAFDQALNELRGSITAGKANALSSARGETQGYAQPTPVGSDWTQVAPNVRIRQVK